MARDVVRKTVFFGDYMSQFKELQEKFFSETGICAVNSQGEPDIDYVNWLETMVENGSSHNTGSPKCYCCGSENVIIECGSCKERRVFGTWSSQ